MRVTRYHDDRLSPTTETEAAAKLLRSNYEALGTWPLAITAYNYGTGGMSQASSEYAGNYDQIIRNYDGAHFGFAWKDYYAEFLAALQIHRYEDAYFPGLKYEEAPPPRVYRTDFAPPRRVVRKRHLSRVHRITTHPRRHGRRRHRETAKAARGALASSRA